MGNAHVPWDPGEESKGLISLNFNYKVNVKDFYTELFCVLTNKTYKTCLMGIPFDRLGHAPEWDFGVVGAQGVIFLTWSCGISM